MALNVVVLLNHDLNQRETITIMLHFQNDAVFCFVFRRGPFPPKQCLFVCFFYVDHYKLTSFKSRLGNDDINHILIMHLKTEDTHKPS